MAKHGHAANPPVDLAGPAWRGGSGSDRAGNAFIATAVAVAMGIMLAGILLDFGPTHAEVAGAMVPDPPATRTDTPNGTTVPDAATVFGPGQLGAYIVEPETPTF
ncbi:hypothetical protein [uncultured Piscinibacter sp.]|uniref:hypothetical protein n=1 Tax=uncultured Piscinibacter sp. TaxID=1131835 RepID=UPI002606C65A|nr:hypothetical protein [uncultured Piscinibacter sp.]